MKEAHLAAHLLRMTPISATDAARLILEAAETCGYERLGDSRETWLRHLRRIIHLGVTAMQQAEKTVSFREAVRCSLESRRDRRPTTLRDLQHFTRRMLRIPGVGEQALRSLSAEDCRRLLQRAFGGSAHSYRKGRAILHSIFAYGMRREWCDRNPVEAIETPRLTEKPISPLTNQEVARLVRTAARPEYRDMRLSLHLMLYCGIRPTEVQRLDPQKDIDRRHSCVIVRPHASKTGGGRVIPLRHASALSTRDFVIPRRWVSRWAALRRAAGFRCWRADVCRHTFASYHAQYFRNPAALQLEMGHRDTRLLWSRYVMACIGDGARRFWVRHPLSERVTPMPQDAPPEPNERRQKNRFGACTEPIS